MVIFSHKSTPNVLLVLHTTPLTGFDVFRTKAICPWFVSNAKICLFISYLHFPYSYSLSGVHRKRSPGWRCDNSWKEIFITSVLDDEFYCIRDAVVVEVTKVFA